MNSAVQWTARAMRLNGGRYLVTCSDGTLLAERTPWPLLDACLALHRMGRWGLFEIYDYVHPSPIWSGDIEEEVEKLRNGGRRVRKSVYGKEPRLKLRDRGAAIGKDPALRARAAPAYA